MQPELANVLITDELTKRGQLRPRLFQERMPMRDLARAMIDDPQLFDTRSQYAEVVEGVTVRLLPLPIGDVVTPLVPAYH